MTNSQTGRDEKTIFSRSTSSEEEKEEEKKSRSSRKSRVDRVGAGSLTRANSHVTDREGERYRGCTSEGYDRGVSATRSLRMRRARSRGPSGRIQSAQRRFVSRNAAIDYHGPAYRYYRPTPANVAPAHAYTYTRVYERKYMTVPPSQTPAALSVSLVLSTSATRTHRELMTPPRIILVPRISSARYCHRERLMFRRNLSSLFYAHTRVPVFSSDLLFLSVSLSLLSPRSHPRTRVDTSSAIEGEIMSFRDSRHESSSLPLSPGREPPPTRSCTGSIEGSMNLASRRI